MSRFLLSREAESDLDSISNRVANDDPAAATRLLDEFESRCVALATTPGAGWAREELGSGLRSSHLAKYVIFYVEDADGVVIVRILHGHRDLPRLFD